MWKTTSDGISKSWTWKQQISSINLNQDLTLTPELKYSDRGKVKLTFSGTANFNPKIIYNYYFDEQVALIEAEKWVQLITDTIYYSYKGNKTQSNGTKVIDSKFFTVLVCNVFLDLQKTDGTHAFYAPVTILNPEVKPDYQHIATIDSMDAFPRYYLNQEFALRENDLWCRVWERKIIDYLEEMSTR